MVGPSSGSSWHLYVTTIYLFIHAWNHYYTINAVSSSEVERKNTLLRSIAVTEININFEINIKKV